VRYPSGHELPPEKEEAYRKAIRLEKISIAYWISAIIVFYFTVGQSQAMKAAWIEDMLSLFPPVAYLIASRFRNRPPDAKFPWGYHRAITVAYLVTTVALFALGLFIFIDSVERLIAGDHPPIGMVEIFEWQVWLGWFMLAALAYGVVPSLILGRMKRPLSEELHDKVLFADAKMNQADWLTAGAAMLGVIGIGLGIWYADAVAAIIISLDILHEGVKFMRESVSDLADERPNTHDESEPHPLIETVQNAIANTGWVAEAAVRLREQGHLIAVQAWVVGRDEPTVAQIDELTAAVRGLDWRLHDVVISPTRQLQNVPDGLHIRGGDQRSAGSTSRS
jgi:cation diffusion facilitator family transporter